MDIELQIDGKPKTFTTGFVSARMVRQTVAMAKSIGSVVFLMTFIMQDAEEYLWKLAQEPLLNTDLLLGILTMITSKVMWGEYERTGNSLKPEGEISHISIDFGHSKNKRSDKKQIKIGLGTTAGIVTDAKVLSGNMDDKTYNNNKENIEDVDKLLTEIRLTAVIFIT